MDFETIKKIATFVSTEIEHSGINIELILNKNELNKIQEEVWAINKRGAFQPTDKFEMTIGNIKFKFTTKD